MSTVVTLDLGNSRLKFARWRVLPGERPELVTAASLGPSVGELIERTRALVTDRELDRVVLSSVAAVDRESEFVNALAHAFGSRFEPHLDPRLSNTTRVPGRVGRDRLFAARGAWSLTRTPAIVIDAGTCVTVDAVAPPADPCPLPRFLGGAIAPGPALLAEALARGGARLPRIEPRVGAHALGRDTEEALQAGVVIGLRGAVRELVLGIERESGLSRPICFWTGGASALLCEPPLFLERALRVEPDLVHLGMLSALGHEWS